jgi:hypothetical protein
MPTSNQTPTTRGASIKRALAARQALGEPIGRKRSHDWAAIIHWHLEGLTNYRIAKKLKIGSGVVSYVIKQHKEGRIIETQ